MAEKPPRRGFETEGTAALDVTTGQEFITLLRKSRLLDAAQSAEAERELAASPDLNASAWAQQLVARGWITEWQSRQLLSGRYGFFMGKYKLLERLGGGGMGVVFTAHHAMTDRVVALKVMNKTVLSNPLAMACFQAEVRLLCALNHPNIIAAYDADCAGGTHFLVMEYGRGQDLRAWLQKHEQLPIDWVCECIRQAAIGLEHAHQRGLVHRDIKPENLLVDDPQPWSRPQVKILDLGLARWMGDEPPEEAALRAPGQIMGTADYIAPEQVEQTELADVRSDIFSLGCTLFKCLTGSLPFDGANYAEKLAARVTQDAKPASSLRPEIPRELDSVIEKMLRRDPEERYQTPAEVALALYPFTSEGKLAKPKPPPPPIAAQRQIESPAALPASAPSGDQALGSFLDQLSSGDERRAILPRSSHEPPAGARTPGRVLQPVSPQPSTPVIFEQRPELPSRAFPQPAAPQRSPAAASSMKLPPKNWTLGIGAGVAISIPILALLFWSMRPATLVLDWPVDAQQGSRIDIDGKPIDAVSGANPVSISLSPGDHRIVIRRRGYEQLEWNVSLGRGDRIERQVQWKHQEPGQGFGFGVGKNP